MSSPLTPAAARVPPFACIVAFAAGTLVLGGYLLDLPALESIGFGGRKVNPATAICFLLAALSLWLQRRPAPAVDQLLARGAAIAILVIGMVRLAGYVGGYEPGVDSWLFYTRMVDHSGFPNRMAPNAAFSFIALALALLFQGSGRRNLERLAEGFAMVVALVALMAIFGHAYGVPMLTGIGRYIPMALPTAIVLLTVSLGVLYACPAGLWVALLTRNSPGGSMARRLLPWTVVLMFMLGWLRLTGERMGLYGPEFGVTAYTLANVTILTALVWWSAISLDRSDAQRREIEAQRERFFAVTPDLMCIAARDGYFQRVNPAWEKLLGYPAQELLAKPFLEFVHPDDRAATVEVMSVLSVGKRVTDFENRYCRADGGYLWFSWNAIPDSQDGLIYATGRDVTEQKRSRDQLQQSEERVRSIIDAAHDAFIAIDADGVICGWNAQAERTFGWPRERAMSNRLSDLVIPTQYRAAHEHGMRHFLATGEGAVLNERIEITALRRDGAEFPVELTIWPVNADGVYTFNAFVRDITQRKEIEETQAKIAAIVEFSDDAIMSKTLDGIITTWNPGAERLFGYNASEAIGQPMAMLIPPEWDGEEAHILDGIRRGEPRHFECVRMHKDGTRIQVAASISPIMDGAGQVVGASKVVRDITKRKQAEDNILALNAELSANATQLQQANRELEAFSYTISHDLRAPLRHIDGYARMLQEDATQLEPELRRYLDAISTSARTMGMLIDDLLAFSRLGRKPVDRVPVDMAGIARSALQELGSGATAAAVVLGDLPEAHADPVLLKQVWINLLSNALKYSAPRGASARIELSGERDGAVARYRIRDNGVGFDMRYADKLFGVFQRLHSQDEFEGTGVGLAIVQRIVARHGGRIWAEAEPGRGATFTMELPQTDAIQTEDIA